MRARRPSGISWELGPVYYIAHIAGALRPPPLGSGIAAIMIMGMGLTVVCWQLLWLLRWGRLAKGGS